MTPQESELIAMKEMAEWRIRKILPKDGPMYESALFNRTSRGLRRSDWDEVLSKLIADGFIVRDKSETQGVSLLRFVIREVHHA